MDRRVIRTKRELENALIRLLNRKHIQEITVKELAEEADITRATFYQYYSSPYDMLKQMQATILDAVSEIIGRTQIGNSYSFFYNIFTYLSDEAVRPEVLSFDHGGGTGYDLIGDALHDNYMLRWNNKLSQSTANYFEYYRHYIIFGCSAIVERWVQSGRQESPEVMARLIANILPDEKIYLKPGKGKQE